MARVAALHNYSVLVRSCSPILSLGACCATKPCAEKLHTSKTLFSAARWFCTFWKGPHYYSVGDFKHFPNSFWCSLMHSHAQHSELQRHRVCLYNQSPANPHDYRNGTLAHALSPWQSDSDPPHPQPLTSFFFPPLCYDRNWWFSVFEAPSPLGMCMQPGSLCVVMADEYC